MRVCVCLFKQLALSRMPYVVKKLTRMEENDSSETNVDTLLHNVGSMGKYQYLLMLLFSYINVISAFHYFGQIFIGIQPEYQCKLLDNENPSYVNVTSCSKITLLNNETFEQPCNSGWNYKNYHGYQSIVQNVSKSFIHTHYRNYNIKSYKYF